MTYNPSEIEPKWQKIWEEKKQNVADISGAQKPFYNLMMFPYPSAEGLHVGSMYAFTAADVYGRFKKLQGFDVFEPIGLDGFGIHSENYALKIGRHPKEHAAVTEKNFYAQLHKIGNMYDWSRTVETYKPDYYKWTQWIFIKMFEAGLAYRAKAQVNFCPKCKTVLSDEQVIDEKCERCSTEVIKKELEQWFFRITKYAEQLLANLEKLDWAAKVKTSQKNWIGKKEGINITYEVVDSKEKITVFTTAPVNFGATFLAVAPEHSFIIELAKSNKEVAHYVAKAKAKTQEERIAEGQEKTGVFTGKYVKNHVTGENIPVWVADFVLADFGTGAIQGCPGHDKRDWQFAKKFGISIPRVIVGGDGYDGSIEREDQVIEHGQKGHFINSDFLNGLDFEEGLQRTMDFFEEKGWGKRIATYHLRDWLISRQRYWGPPIPMIFCQKCQWQPVPEKDLPVLLPEIADYQPKGEGKGPLANHPEFYKTECPKCGGSATRETDVSDTFLDSAWYELRYPSVDFENAPFDKEITKKWLPVDMYTGGSEHANLHLMYFRFATMALHDLGYLDFEEPTKSFFAHGMIIKDGAKMSKSKGNVVNPDEYIAKFGADTLRLYLMFMGPADQGGDFRDSGMAGMRRWLEKVYKIISTNLSHETHEAHVIHEINKLIQKAAGDIEKRHYNTAISAMMIFINSIADKKIDKKTLEKFLVVLAPFAPHLAEELWQRCHPGGQSPIGSSSVHSQSWPKIEKIAGQEEKVTIVITVNGKPHGTMAISNQEIKALKETQIIEMAKTVDSVKKYLLGKTIKKTIYAAGKIVNLVVV